MKTILQNIKNITSISNPYIKRIRNFLIHKKYQHENLFLVEGSSFIIKGIKLGWNLDSFLFLESYQENSFIQEISKITLLAGGIVIKTSKKIFSSITNRENPQYALGIFKKNLQDTKQIIFSKKTLFLGLDRIRDPGNLGTIIRTSDAVNATGIILIGNTTNPFSLKTVRATMGSIFSVPIYCMNEENFLSWRKKFSGLVIGTHLRGLLDYREVNYSQYPLMILMGNEKFGLTENLLNCCQKLVSIPQVNTTNSLNISVAAGIILYESRKNFFKLHRKNYEQ